MTKPLIYGDLPRSIKELVPFIQGRWRKAYAGKHLIPLWDEALFAWRLQHMMTPREYWLSVAAYDHDEKLIGCALVFPKKIRIETNIYPMAVLNWMTVQAPPGTDPHEVSLGLLMEAMNRQVEFGMVGCIGTSQSRFTQRFWEQALARLGMIATLPFRSETLFVYYPLVTIFSEWNDGHLSEFHRRIQVRRSHDSDLSSLFQLLCEEREKIQFSQVVEAKELREQMKSPRSFTWLAEKGGVLVGVLHYDLVPLLVEEAFLSNATIDYFVFHGLSYEEQVDFIRETMTQMKAQGCFSASLSTLPGIDAVPFEQAGFFKVSGSRHVFCGLFYPALKFPPVKTCWIEGI